MSDILFNLGTTPPEKPPKLDLGRGVTSTPAAIPAAIPADDLVKEGSTDSFVVDVVETSKTLPVIVDFWSPQSPACQQLMPMLETHVRRAGGLIKMVKINVDTNQALAQQLQVQSVPTVFAFKDGRPVDAFAGVQGDAQLQIFFDKLIGDAKPPLQAAMDMADEALSDGDFQVAEDVYTSVLGDEPEYLPALAGMIRAIAGLGEYDRAQEITDSLEAKTLSNPAIAQAISALELAKQNADIDTSGLDDLIKQVAAKPKDLQALFDLAQARYAAGQSEAAIDDLLTLIGKDRAWNEEAARKQLVQIFDALGMTDPLTVASRKRLSAILFS